MMTPKKNATAIFAQVALGLSTLLLLVAAVPLVRHRRQSTADAPRRQFVPGRVRTGTEVVAYFIASSTCGASQHPELPRAIREIRAQMTKRSKGEGKHFVLAGVALDELPEPGLQFLKGFGSFDEVIAGGSWVGTGSLDFLIRQQPGPLALPQLLIVERQINQGTTAVTVSSDRVVSRLVGYAEIFKQAGITDSEQSARR